MEKIPCKRCGTKVLPSTIKNTSGLCMPCFKEPNKKPLSKRIDEMAERLGIRIDEWHTQLPNTKQIEELDAQLDPVQQCDCCKYLTLSKKGIAERCGVCGWRDQTGSNVDLNDGLGLEEARRYHKKNGVCQEKYFMKTRLFRYREQPPSDEILEDKWLNQSEESTEEREALIFDIYDRVSGDINKLKPITEEERTIHDIYYISVEAGSGVSFEQYFRWVDGESVINIVQKIKKLEMNEVATIVQSAITAAFPNGYPESDIDLEEAKDLSDEQLEKLEGYYYQFESYEGLIINRLSEYADKHGIS